MKSLPGGIFVLTLILVFIMSNMDANIFLNLHSFLIVIGGTLGVFLYATPAKGIASVARALIHLLRPDRASNDINDQLVALNRNKNAKLAAPHPLISYAQELWEKGIEPEMFQALILRRVQEVNGAHARVVATLRNLAKYPPALGMTGTVIGLVSLFSHLTPDNKSSLGPSLALAMTATFYGLLMANMFLMPLADRIQVMQLATAEENAHVCKILLMIHQDQGESVIKDEIHVEAAA